MGRKNDWIYIQVAISGPIEGQNWGIEYSVDCTFNGPQRLAIGATELRKIADTLDRQVELLEGEKKQPERDEDEE